MPDAIGGRRLVGIVGELGSDLVDLAPVKRVAHAFEVDAAVEDEQSAEDPCAAAPDGGESRSPAAARRGARELDREGVGTPLMRRSTSSSNSAPSLVSREP